MKIPACHPSKRMHQRGATFGSLFSLIFRFTFVFCGWLPGAFAAPDATSYTAEAEPESYVTTVIDRLPPERSGDSWIFLLSSGGRALRVADGDRPSIEVLSKIAGRPNFVQLEIRNLGDVDQIVSLKELPEIQVHSSASLPIEPLATASEKLVWTHDFTYDDRPYTPEGVYDFFKSMRLRRGAQCFHRAYYWAHQLWRNTGVQSQKAFMFFSWKYIRTFNYHWWFHVAPFVHDDSGREMVIDPTYLKKPVTLREWTDNFLRNDPECPVVEKYMGHSQHGKGQWCYVVKSPMQYYHPNTIEETNKTGVPIRKWDAGRLATSRRSR